MEGEFKLDVTMAKKDNKALLENDHSTIVLSFGDKVLRQISKEAMQWRLWTKLESLYMTRYLSSEKTTTKQLDEFNKLILDLENINVQIDDEDQTLLLLLLCSLPKTHDQFKVTLLYGTKTLS